VAQLWIVTPIPHHETEQVARLSSNCDRAVHLWFRIRLPVLLALFLEGDLALVFSRQPQFTTNCHDSVRRSREHRGGVYDSPLADAVV
jgi:hypothetical protein